MIATEQKIGAFLLLLTFIVVPIAMITQTEKPEEPEINPWPLTIYSNPNIKDEPDFSRFYPAVQQHKDYIILAAELNEVDPMILASIVQIESSGINKQKSNKGAQGLAQLMPATFKDMKGNIDYINDELHNLEIAGKYIKWLLARPYINGDITKMVMAYNAGPTNVANGKAKTFPETISYLKKFNSLYYQNDLTMN